MKTEPNWNELIEEYDNHDHAIADWRLGYSIVEQLLGEMKGKNVLDYGCGTGKFARRLDNLGAMVRGVDISAKAIDKAKDKYSRNINYELITNSDISHIKPNTFDCAVVNFVLCCIKDDKEVRKILNQIYERLKDNGVLVMLEPHPNALGYDFISMYREKPAAIESGIPIKVQLSGLGKTFEDYWRPQEEYLKLLEDSGFRVVEVIEPTPNQYKDEKFWKDEKIQSPFLIIKAVKD